METGKNRFKIFFIGTLFLASGLVFSSCSTSGKAGRNKNCNCPKWSYHEVQLKPGLMANEKI